MNMTMDVPAWYVVQPHFRQDAAAADELEANGFEVFIPTYQRFSLIRHTKGRRRAVTMPLMEGYLFAKMVGLDIAHLEAILLSDRLSRNARPRLGHVRSLYRIGRHGRPPRCNEKVVAQLIEKCGKGFFDQGKTRSGAGYLKDDQVLITDGPLAGAIVRFKDGKCRPGFIRVVHDRLFGVETTLTVPFDAVEAA